MDPKPTLTSRELSLHEAQAGIHARAEAGQSGGDPSQIGSLLRTAAATPAQGAEYAVTISGVGFHALCLAVILASQEVERQAAEAKRPVNDILTIARLAACFHDPVSAYEMLTQGEGLSELDNWAVSLVAKWSPDDIAAFTLHVQKCKQRSPSLRADAEDAPGKSKARLKGTRTQGRR